jgi:hypothetical protein
MRVGEAFDFKPKPPICASGEPLFA